jgi:hypothetical protein
MTRSGSRAPLFDHLVGGRKQRARHVQTGAFTVFRLMIISNFVGVYNRKVGRSLAAQNAINVTGRAVSSSPLSSIFFTYLGGLVLL